MRAALTIALAALTIAPAAAAAAEHTATAGEATPHATWSGGPGAGVFAAGPAPAQLDCAAIDYCDSTLIKVTDDGDLALHAKAQDSGTPAGSTVVDLDVYAYASDASGARGDLLGSSTSSSNDESIGVIGNLAGDYVLFVTNYALGAGSYDGDLTWTPPPPPEEDEGF